MVFIKNKRLNKRISTHIKLIVALLCSPCYCCCSLSVITSCMAWHGMSSRRKGKTMRKLCAFKQSMANGKEML